MPTNMTPDPTFGGAVNSKGLVSLQRGLTAADAGTKFFGFDPASILFSSALRYILGRGRDWPEAVETTPEMQVEQLYDYLQQTEGQIPEGGAEGRDAMWGGLLERAKELGMNDIADQLMQRPEVANQFSGNPVEAGKSVADNLLKEIQDFAPFWDQAQVVLNPATGQSTIVFGTPPAGQPVVQVGNLPQSNTNVGVTTGVPILDQAINSVLSKQGGLDSGSIRDAVIDIISEKAGLDPAAAAAVMGEDLDTILSTSNAVLADKASRLGVDLSGPKKEDDTVDNVIRGPAPAGEMGPTLEELMGETGSTPPSVVDTLPTSGVTVVPGSLTPADLGEDSQKNVTATVQSPSTGATGAPAQPAYGQGIRGMKTEKAGVVELENPFNAGDMSLANILMLLAGESDNAQRAQYYGGGAVDNAKSVDEIIRMLRG